jgi:bla regulator protein BlaR1
MEHFLINSSVCLFVLWLAYKLLLENTSWHGFKRFYLIGALILSMLIPFIVVETIVIPMEEIPFINDAQLPFLESGMEKPGVTFRWLYIGWSLYVIGAFIMLWRFGKNLYSFRIQQEDEISSYAAYQLILRNSFTIPHSFFTRIFISKKDQESNKIPRVVLEHEKAHLDQKHSLDVLFIEFLLIAFWFNPLLYIIRYSIKLNHEFLADRAVLSQGISTTAYQEILLEQATTSYQQAMANTFTFPIIKKRFHIMKTHTSNTSLVFRSLALIPVIALLVISCGKEETEFQEVELPVEFKIIEETPSNRKIIAVDPSDPEGNITINGAPHVYKINGEQINIYNEQGELQDFESQGYEVIKAEEIIEVVEVLENLTSKNIKEYNFLAKRHQEFIKEKGHVVLFNEDTKRMQIIFNSMNEKQRAENEPWPYINWENDIRAGQIPPPPPPPPPAAPSKDFGYIKVDGKIHYYTLKEGDQAFYDRWGSKIDLKGKTVEYIKQEDLPPPPPPASPLDYIENAGDNIHYYIDDKKVTAEKAKAFIKKNGNKGVQIMPVNGVNSLKMFSTNHKMSYKIKSSKNDTTTWVKDFEKGFSVNNKSNIGRDPIKESSKKPTTRIKNGTWKDVETILEKSTANSKKSVVDNSNIYLNGKQISEEEYENIKDAKSITSLEVKKIKGENYTYITTNSIESRPAETLKKEPTDLSIRKAFLMAALRQQKPVKFKINQKQVTLAEVETLIKNNNKIPFDLITQNGNEHTLAFFNDSSLKMSKETLSQMYSKFFQTIDPKKNTSSFMISKSHKKVGSIITPQKKLRMIGDPIDVININKDAVKYYVDGKLSDYKKALQVLTKNSHWNVYLDTIGSKKSMVISTYNAAFGPEDLSNPRSC